MPTEENSYRDHLQDVLSFYGDLLEDKCYSGLIIPSGNPKKRFLDDNYYPFKVNVHFSAILPVTDAPHSYIFIQPGKKPILAYYQPEDYWHVVPSDPEGFWVENFDIHVFRGVDDWQKLLPESRDSLAWIGESQDELISLKIKKINPKELLNPIHYRRAYKSDYEMACLRVSSLMAAKGHFAAKDAFLSGCSEMEIHLAYLQASNQKEEELPYGNIIALNSHGAVLHYTDLERQRYSEADSYSFLLDAGAVYRGYCSDITRTWAFRDGEFNDLIQQFDQLQLELIEELSVGKSYIDMHILTHLKIAQFLKDADFIICDPQTALDTGISSTFYPHGLGHMLGMQVHDIGGHQVSVNGEIKSPPAEHPFLRLTKDLELGFCITMEPGVYFIDMLLKKLATTKHAPLVNWGKVETFKKYGGIRIEDDVIIKEKGVENLTRNSFAELSNSSAN